MPKPLFQGTRIKVMFITPSGPVLGVAEMLSPVSRTEQPFRFVALARGDQRRLQAITGFSSQPEMPIPAEAAGEVDVEHQWIDKYRDAMSRNPPPRRFLKRMLDAIIPGSK